MSDMSGGQLIAAYKAVARNLREFGYPDVTTEMVEEIHGAFKAGTPLPHGIIGMMAGGQFEEHPKTFGEAPE